MVSPKKTQDHSFYKSQDLKKHGHLVYTISTIPIKLLGHGIIFLLATQKHRAVCGIKSLKEK